jgi:hypothetical protein
MGAEDHQFFYELRSPNLVYSFDHGHFFPFSNRRRGLHAGQWTAAGLAGAPPVTEFDRFFAPAGLTHEIDPILRLLERITAVDIADAVSRPPDEWGTRFDDRVAMCVFLERRQQEVLQLRVGP